MSLSFLPGEDGLVVDAADNAPTLDVLEEDAGLPKATVGTDVLSPLPTP